MDLRRIRKNLIYLLIGKFNCFMLDSKLEIFDISILANNMINIGY